MVFVLKCSDAFRDIGKEGKKFHTFANSFKGQLVFGAVSGGVAAELTGGNFLMGAATDAIVWLANEWLHGIDNDTSRETTEEINKIDGEIPQVDSEFTYDCGPRIY